MLLWISRGQLAAAQALRPQHGIGCFLGDALMPLARR